MSLLDAAERFASLDRSQVVLDSARCLHSQDQFSECAACFDVCPAEAITPGKPPGLDAAKCQSCLACLPACPTGAYHADDAVASLLNCAGRIESGPVEVICARNTSAGVGRPGSLGVQIPGCLAGLGMGAYLLLASLGLEKVIARTDACAGCDWASLSPRVEAQVSGARLFLSAWDRAEAVVCQSEVKDSVERPLWDSKNPPLSRRDMFRMLAQQGKFAMARAMESGAQAADRGPGRDRMRLLTAVRHLPAPGSGNTLPLGALGFAFISLSESCDACAACAKGCPVGALHFEKNLEASGFSLKLSPQECTGCDLCAHVCMPEAITVDHAPGFVQVFAGEILLQQGELVKCQDCGAWIAKRDGSRLCSLCSYRHENPFGSKLPPALQARLAKKNQSKN